MLLNLLPNLQRSSPRMMAKISSFDGVNLTTAELLLHPTLLSLEVKITRTGGHKQSVTIFIQVSVAECLSTFTRAVLLTTFKET